MAQGLTIPEQLARSGVSLVHGTSMPSGIEADAFEKLLVEIDGDAVMSGDVATPAMFAPFLDAVRDLTPTQAR